MSTGPFTACARPRPRPPRPGRARSSSPCSSGGTRACRRSPRRRRFDAQRRQPVQLGELGPVDVGGAVDHRSALTGRSSGTSTTGLAGPDDYQAAASRCVRSKSSTERHRTPGYRVLATRTRAGALPVGSPGNDVAPVGSSRSACARTGMFVPSTAPRRRVCRSVAIDSTVRPTDRNGSAQAGRPSVSCRAVQFRLLVVISR
jgi:hypothetical protein